MPNNMTAATMMTEAGRKAISDFLRRRVERGDVPAVVATIVNRDSQLYLDAFGKRDVASGVDATPDTIFRIASMTKPVTSFAAMMLRDSGGLAPSERSESRGIALDDPIAKHLPDYVQPPVATSFDEQAGTFESRPAARPITIRDLLTHTSGLAYPPFHRGLARLSAKGVPDAALPLVHDPGARWTYGPNTAILGRIIARVSGETVDAYCKSRIFDPLGMNDTAYAVPAEHRARVVTQHQREPNGNLVERPNPPVIQSKGRGDDGLFSTARDYAAFLQLFLNGGRHGATRLVSERTIEEMISNQIGPLVLERQSPRETPLAMPFPPGAGKDKFGFGFQIETEPSEKGMRSPGSLSWAGIFNTHFWFDLRRQIAAVVLMQQLPAFDRKVVDLLRGFERLVYQQAG